MDLPEVAYQILSDDLNSKRNAWDVHDAEVSAAAKSFLLKQFESQLEVQEVQKAALRKQLGSGLAP